MSPEMNWLKSMFIWYVITIFITLYMFFYIDKHNVTDAKKFGFSYSLFLSILPPSMIIGPLFIIYLIMTTLDDVWKNAIKKNL